MNTMRKIKRTVSLMLAFALFLVMIPVPALAAESGDTGHVHDFTSVVVPPTCTEKGYTFHRCQTCSDYYSDNEVPALGHSFEVEDVVDPTCSKGGYTLYTCTVCGISETGDETEATGKHSYEVTETVDSTCTEDGYSIYTCTGCGHSYTETILADHEWEFVYLDPTCEEAGLFVWYCTVCDHFFTEVDDDPEYAATGHNYVSTVYAPSCTEDGITVNTCANCGDTYYSDPVDALPHTYVSTVIAPTCTVAGYTKHVCKYCGDSYTSDPVNALTHSYTVRFEGSDTIFTCKICGDVHVKSAPSDSTDPIVTHKRVTKFTSGNSYVIAVYDSRTAYALSHAGNRISAVKITISGGQITSSVTDDMLWEYSAGKLYYTENGTNYYLYSGPSKVSSGTGFATLTVSTTNYSSISYSSNKLRIGSFYTYFNGGTIKGYRSGDTTYLMERS